MTEILRETATTVADSRQVSSGPKDGAGSPPQRVTAHFDPNAVVPIPEQPKLSSPPHIEKEEEAKMIDEPLNVLEKTPLKQSDH